MNALRVLRGVALSGVVAGAAGSVAFMLRTGRRNPSRLLIVAFVVWVLAPFVGLLCADIVSKRWSVPARAGLYGVMLILTVVSLAIYGDVAFGPPRPQPAFYFLVVPAASWLAITVVVAIGRFAPRRQSPSG